MSLDDDARAELALLAGAHRLRTPRVVDGPQGPELVLDGQRVTSFASNDYLGLACDPRLVRAAQDALDDAGAGAGASRLIVGNQREHERSEAAIADWLRVAGVRLFNSGYAANVGVISTLARAGDVIFSDELNHASIIDGCRLARADVRVYPHGDLAALEQQLAGGGGRRRFVVSESLFSMDGDSVDVARLAALARKHDAALILDEAHALGVFGPEGRGFAAIAGVTPDIVIGTFGKALGSFGAFAATTRAVADLLWNRARSLVFSTSLPASAPAAARAAIEIARGLEGDARRKKLHAMASSLRARVPALGGDRESPIAPLVIGDDREVMAMTAELLAHGVFVQGIRPPTVPERTARLRVSLSAAHSQLQIDELAARLPQRVRKTA
ncbi:MAG TPA: 8-amino-7-oxononanoate synthase [Kofleriaceae bacterium]|jgi:8-amino-7-oxononanoate synthase